jgi:uncharacterized protein (DUF1778 family)
MPRRKRQRAPGAGRKTLPADRRRARLISVRTTRQLGEQIDEAAKREERTVSDWMVAAAESSLAARTDSD